MRRKEDIVYYDFQGWPGYKMNLREVLLGLGGRVEEGKIVFDLDSPMMEVYPSILEDDGMGYGVDENVIVEASADAEHRSIIIFRERKPTDEEQAELIRQADSHMSIEKMEAFIEALEKNKG